jgi:hypothetical protein
VIDVDEAADAIYDTGGFGESVTFTGGITVNAIFTTATDESVSQGITIEAMKPTLMCKTSGITAVKPKHTVTVRSTVYVVERIEKIGTGDSVVYLSKQ